MKELQEKKNVLKQKLDLRKLENFKMLVKNKKEKKKECYKNKQEQKKLNLKKSSENKDK